MDGGGGAAIPRPGRTLCAGEKTMPVSTTNSTGSTATMGSMIAGAALKTHGVFAPSSFTFFGSALRRTSSPVSRLRSFWALACPSQICRVT